MGRKTTPEMLKALELVEQGMNRHKAALTAGVRPASLYCRLADRRRKEERKQNQEGDNRVSQ